MINSTFTSKWAHVCILVVIAASLAVAQDSSSFSSCCSIRVLKVVSKFHNDPTVEKSRIIVLLEQVMDLCGKRENYDVKGISLTSDIIS